MFVCFLIFFFWSGVLLTASVIQDGAGYHAHPHTRLPTLESLSIYPEVLKPPKLHLRLTELRNLGKSFAGHCIEKCFPTSSLPALPSLTCVRKGFEYPPPQYTHLYIGRCSRTGELIPTALLDPTPFKPPYPNLFYKFVSTLCLSTYMAFVFFNTANVYHLPNRLDRFCFL